jgi:peptidoglycan/xylan/chitin deacetylase (PgdA/CDA1 family)
MSRSFKNFRHGFQRTLWSLSLVATVFAAASGCTANNSPNSAITSGPQQDDLFQQKNILSFGLKGSKKIVLTFDDGPSKHTMELLSMLRAADVQASFFMLGQNVKGHEAALSQMRADRHIVANHTYSHVNLREMKFVSDTTLLLKQIGTTHRILEPYFLPTQRLYFRAPYGNWRAQHADVLNENPALRTYIGPVFWTIGGDLRFDASGKIYSAADWDCWGKKVSVETCAQGYIRETEAQQGGVILMHDVDVRSLKLAKIVIDELKARGYKFISLDDVRSLDQYQ